MLNKIVAHRSNHESEIAWGKLRAILKSPSRTRMLEERLVAEQRIKQHKEVTYDVWLATDEEGRGIGHVDRVTTPKLLDLDW